LRDFWQRKDKKLPDKDTNINMERDEVNGSSEPSMDERSTAPEPGGNDAETAKLLTELDDLRQTLLRRQADFDNYRKRIEKERTEDSKRTTARLIEGLIPVIDGFEHALAAHREKEYEVYRKGFELIYRLLLDNITRMGVERVDPIGKQFDPHAHQAMDRLETADHEDGTIVQVFQPGYVFHGRTLRPAMVRVAVNAVPASKKTVN
jgi:molecular chaperone GrpE